MGKVEGVNGAGGEAKKLWDTLSMMEKTRMIELFALVKAGGVRNCNHNHNNHNQKSGHCIIFVCSWKIVSPGNAPPLPPPIDLNPTSVYHPIS